MNQEMQNALLKNARKDLIAYPRIGIKQKTKNLVKIMIGRGNSIPKRDCISWPNGMLALAIEDVNAEDQTLDVFLSKWSSDGSQVRSIEDAVSGLAFFKKAFAGNDSREYQKASRMIYDYLMAAPKDEEGSFLYNPKQNNKYVLVDMIGMVCPFLSLWGREMSCDEAYEIAEKQILNFVKYGMDDETLLPYHGYEICTDSKLGIIGWGRAVGWLLMGEAGYLLYAPKERPNYAIIEEQFKITVDTIRKYQNKSDLYEWKIDIFPKTIDTSASAMILESIATWLLRKYEDNSMNDAEVIAKYLDMLSKGFEELTGYIKDGKVYGAQAECLGLGLHPDKFGSYPWSVGPTLSLMMKLKKLGVIK